MKDELKNGQKMRWAQLLYIHHNKTIREIAIETDSSEAEVRDWARQGKWDGLKKSLLLTKQTQLELLYKMLASVTTKIDNGEEDAKDMDKLLKLTRAIKDLEAEESVSQSMDVGLKYLEWLAADDPHNLKEAAISLNKFVKWQEYKN